MGITYIGNCGFDDLYEPAYAKSDWGVDTLVRTVKGAGPLLASYLSSLKQGQTFFFAGVRYYLQTWQPGDGQYFVEVKLNYKGFSAGLPKPYSTLAFAQETASLTTNTPEKATRDILYIAPQSSYRYISSGKPKSARYSTVDSTTQSKIIWSTVTKENGQRVIGNVDAALLTALTPSNFDILRNSSATPIHGTEYWECEDVVVRSLK